MCVPRVVGFVLASPKPRDGVAHRVREREISSQPHSRNQDPNQERYLSFSRDIVVVVVMEFETRTRWPTRQRGPARSTRRRRMTRHDEQQQRAQRGSQATERARVSMLLCSFHCPTQTTTTALSSLCPRSTCPKPKTTLNISSNWLVLR